MRKWVFAAGVAVGYVLGARAGRERYEQIAKAARRVRDNETVRGAAGVMQAQVGNLAEVCRDKLKHSSIGERIFGESGDDRFGTPDPKPEYWEAAGVSTTNRSGFGNNGTQGF